MKSVRAIILRKYTKQLERMPDGPEKERVKGKVYAFLQRCKRQDVKRDRKT
jgi:hypothetical protein